MPARPNIYNVAPGRPFLEEVARAILSGDLPATGAPKPGPFDLPAMTILLPTRRATRALQEAFLKASGGRAMLLPAIRPIAEAEEDQGLIESLARGLDGDTALALPPAVGKLERQLVLTELVNAWSRALRDTGDGESGDSPNPGAGTPAQAANLAHDLAALMDAVETENVSLADLSGLVPDNFSAHWQKTLRFLEIVTRYWPARLAERGLLSPMDRRNQLILAEARRLVANPPLAPIIIAGVTGSIPATTELMRAVLRLPQGAIVLPALDQGLDDPSWQRLADREKPHPEHPQFGFRQLLERLKLERRDVAELPGAALKPERLARNRLISEAMRPAGSMEQWRTYVREADMMTVASALSGISLIEAPAAEDEAETVALILREAAETPGRTAALVSPDRLLARRVAIRLQSWGIRVDDSAGRPFGKTVPGTFLDLVANAWATSFAPAELMALLKHPLTRLGLSAGDVRRAARNLELSAFRAPYLGSGLDALDIAVERAVHASAPDSGERRHATVRRMGDRDWAQVRDLVQRLRAAFAPLTNLAATRAAQPLRTWTAAHIATAEALAAPVPAVAATAAGAPSSVSASTAGATATSLPKAEPALSDPGLTAPSDMVIAAPTSDLSIATSSPSPWRGGVRGGGNDLAPMDGSGHGAADHQLGSQTPEQDPSPHPRALPVEGRGEPAASMATNPDGVPAADSSRAAHIGSASDVAATTMPSCSADAAASPLWQGEAGEAAWKIFESLADPVLPATALDSADYPDFYRTLIAGETVRPRVPVHPRLFIWGPFEARLQQTDVMILGSLNEGTWPAAADPGAWLNRPMRAKLGLPAPEDEIGRAAHDLTTFLGAETVILTRADKVDGVPRVASRWLLRLRALLDGLGLAQALTPPAPWLAWARARDYIDPARAEKPRPPEPRPPLELRPVRASVSDIETWVANPYAIYARRVLRLDPLPVLGAVPGPQEKGQIIHLALSRFTERHPEALPRDIVGAFLAAAADVIRDFREEPRVRAFWLPRLHRFAEWFAATEAERREGVTRLMAEVPANHILDLAGGPFELTARADRIDVLAEGALITDYKTGQIPSQTAVRSGAAPQLPLEAAMALAGAFAGLPPTAIAGLRYIRARGDDPPGEEVLVKLKDGDWNQLAAAAIDGATRLVAEFRDPATPFRALRRPRFRYDYDDFAHLARVGEWTADDSDEEAA